MIVRISLEGVAPRTFTPAGANSTDEISPKNAVAGDPGFWFTTVSEPNDCMAALCGKAHSNGLAAVCAMAEAGKAMAASAVMLQRMNIFRLRNSYSRAYR